ncbi:hypothetical protein [Ligilactobacillus agilis]|uniref:hypothetical protein n=1 Tax=Ligilactobacillus agilis TaxID=1601 RepID=UPI001558C99C|nr:hypothetical protein [Ligilactobacillus agilis]
MKYEVPSIAINKHLKQDILKIETQKVLIKSESFKEKVVDNIFKDKEVRTALKMLSEV